MSEERMELITKLLDQQTAILKELTGDENGNKEKAVGNFMSAQRLHGDGGLFASPGLEREIINSMVRPYGIGGVLPIFPSVDEDPTYGTITGVSDDYGDEPTDPCDDAPTGYMKGCTLTARFGMVRRDTEDIDIGKVMLRLHRGDFTDLVLIGEMLGMDGLAPQDLNQAQVLDLVTANQMVQTGVRTERVLNKQMWQGTFGVGTEFPGLDSQIATGIIDSESSTLCPAVDSDVKDFNYNDITEGDIVEYVSMLHWYLNKVAEGAGLDPVQHVLVMRPELWYELSSIWPVLYNTSRLTNLGTASQVFVNGRENVDERDRFRRQMVLPVNGEMIPVITDTGIFEHNSTNNANLIGGEFASSIYLVPLRIRGSFPVLYREYTDFRQAQPDANLLRGLQDFFWTDEGVYSWAYEGNKWCFKLALRTHQRIILRTPQLAGRIDAVKYSPLQHLRDPDPDSPYYKNGGVSLPTGNVLQAPNAIWNS